MVKGNLFSYFPARVYVNIYDLAETIMNSADCRSSTLKHSIKDNNNIAHPESVYVYVLSNQI